MTDGSIWDMSDDDDDRRRVGNKVVEVASERIARQTQSLSVIVMKIVIEGCKMVEIVAPGNDASDNA